MSKYYSFQMRISDITTVNIEKRGPDGQNFGHLRGQLRWEANREQLSILQKQLDQGDVERSVVRQFGDLLFNILFDEELRVEFRVFREKAIKDASKLRLEMNIDEQSVPMLAAVPWEFLCLPVDLREGQVWLATLPDVTLSRWRDRHDPTKSVELAEGEKLRIALVVSSPEDLNPVQYIDLWSQLENYQQTRNDIDIRLFEKAQAIHIDEILHWKPHLLHVIAHGRFNEGTPQIAFTDNILGQADWTDSIQFAEMFNRYSDCVVILQMCESARLSNEQAFVGIASDLLDQNVPIVIAMQRAISNISALRFSETFYTRLFAGDSLDIAVQEGRHSIGYPSGRMVIDFATPVLFMRAHSVFRMASVEEVFPRDETRRDKETIKTSRQFADLITDKTRNFVGRQYIFDDIEAFLQRESKGYLILEGDPGAGKTAIVAKYVQNTNAIAHFNIRSQGINKAHHFLQTVCTELVHRYDLPYRPLPVEATRDGEFFARILAEAARKQARDIPLVILIDALDEVDMTGHHGNILFLPEVLPENVFIIMTQRRVDIILRHDPGTPFYRLNMNDERYGQRIDQDIIQYVIEATRRYNVSSWIKNWKMDLIDFVHGMAKLSERNFIYLTLVMGDIERGLYDEFNFDQLPEGLENYYDSHWDLMGMRPAQQDHLPRAKLRILYIICELDEPYSRSGITEFVRTDGFEIDELDVQFIIDEWMQFLHERYQKQVKQFSLYHKSFRDFLHRIDVVQAAGVTLEGINKLIADNFWHEVFGDDAPSAIGFEDDTSHLHDADKQDSDEVISADL